MWDISTSDVQNAPSFLIKRLQAHVFSGGQLVGTIDVSVGNKTGFGTPLSCAFEVHKPGVDVYGTSELCRQKHQPRSTVVCNADRMSNERPAAR